MPALPLRVCSSARAQRVVDVALGERLEHSLRLLKERGKTVAVSHDRLERRQELALLGVFARANPLFGHVVNDQ